MAQRSFRIGYDLTKMKVAFQPEACVKKQRDSETEFYRDDWSRFVRLASSTMPVFIIIRNCIVCLLFCFLDGVI